jgi:L-seryl-tRNA(Ser) seleniumtransferase
MDADLLRQLPSVNELLLQMQDQVLIEGHQRVVSALREALDAARGAIRAGEEVPTAQGIIQMAREALHPLDGAGSTTVINATGVIIHTNLGRAVLSTTAQQALEAVARGYSPVEFNLENGARGRRGVSVEHLLCQATGAEAALVVNNCAAATVLMLTALAQDRAVVISRGQLVEIGGGFRIPEIMVQSRARLIEVGTTNRTRLSDYERALRTTPDVAALLRVHASNFKLVGFTQSVSIDEMAGLAGQMQPAVYVLDDLGSGALLDTAQYGLSHEPMPQESIQAGATLAAFSGDKLLGGPQAGILVGTHEAIERCRMHPLARALRADKYTLAALGATVLHYLRGEAVREVPVWRMIAADKEDIRRRAVCCVQALQGWAQSRALEMKIVNGESTVGGGSLPGDVLPTALISLRGIGPDRLAADLRGASTPVIARIQDDCVMLDLRTVLDDQMLIDSAIGR